VNDWLAALCVFVGGGLGAAARWGASRAVGPFDATEDFPWATFGINVVGSALLGALAAVAKDRPLPWLLLGVGVCGGFTTFSTFGWELLRLVEAGRTAAAFGYACASVVGGFSGVLAAARLATAAATP